MEIKEKMQMEQTLFLAKQMLNLDEKKLRVFCESVLEALNKLENVH